VSPDRLPRLDEVVALVVAEEGQAGVVKRLEDSTLREAVQVLDDTAFSLARDLRSLEAAFKWRALAGPHLPKVVEAEIHRRSSPADFTRAELGRILALNDPGAVSRLTALKGPVRAPLLGLDDAKLVSMTRAMSEAQLTSLSSYLTGLVKPAADRMLNAVALSPARLQFLMTPGVRDAVLASSDQLAAVGMVVRSDPMFDLVAFQDDVRLVYDGRVSPWLLWQIYPMSLSALAGVAGLLLLILLRLILGRRPKVVVQVAKGDRRPPPPQT
jgi:hypothetical protein